MAAARSRRPSAATLARRWLALGLIGLIGYAYYHPLRSWIGTRQELQSRRTEVAQLAAQTRQLGYIRPGEHLFIVEGIKVWEKAHSRITGGGK